MKLNNTEEVSYYRVIYGDTDALGVVYNSNYLRIFEMARTEFMRKKAFTYKEVESRGFAMPVVEAYCKYINPAGYDDLLKIITVLLPEGRARLRFDYRMYNEDTGKSIAEGYTIHGCIDIVNRRPVRLPDFIKDLLCLKVSE